MINEDVTNLILTWILERVSIFVCSRGHNQLRRFPAVQQWGKFRPRCLWWLWLLINIDVILIKSISKLHWIYRLPNPIIWPYSTQRRCLSTSCFCFPAQWQHYPLSAKQCLVGILKISTSRCSLYLFNNHRRSRGSRQISISNIPTFRSNNYWLITFCYYFA